MKSLASFRQTIAGRLILLVTVVAAPLVGLQIYYAIDAANSDRGQALDRSLRTARSVRGRIDDQVQNVDTLLTTVAASLPSRHGAVSQGNAALRRIKAGLPPHFGSVSAFDLDGSLLYSAESPPRPGSGNVANSGYFRDALSTGALASGDPLISRTSGKWAQVFARPIRDGDTGAISGVVSVSISPESFQDIFAGVELPSGSVITLINSKGIVLARSLEPEKFIGENWSGIHSIRRMLRDREGAMERMSADGVMHLSGFTTSRLVPWLVYVGIPTETALAPSRAHLRRSMLLTALVAALAIAGAVWIASGIAKPLRRLAGDAAALAGGALSHRSAVAARGEVGELAASFNAMAADLDRDRSRLRESEARLRNLFEQANDGIYVISADNRYLGANARGLDLLGYTRDELLRMGVADVLAPHEVARLAVEPPQMMSGVPHLAEWEHVRKDGTSFPGEVRACESFARMTG